MSAIFTVAGFCAIFAGEYGNDVVLASKFIFITTLLCIITIPIFVMLLECRWRKRRMQAL